MVHQKPRAKGAYSGLCVAWGLGHRAEGSAGLVLDVTEGGSVSDGLRERARWGPPRDILVCVGGEGPFPDKKPN